MVVTRLKQETRLFNEGHKLATSHVNCSWMICMRCCVQFFTRRRVHKEVSACHFWHSPSGCLQRACSRLRPGVQEAPRRLCRLRGTGLMQVTEFPLAVDSLPDKLQGHWGYAPVHISQENGGQCRWDSFNIPVALLAHSPKSRLVLGGAHQLRRLPCGGLLKLQRCGLRSSLKKLKLLDGTWNVL